MSGPDKQDFVEHGVTSDCCDAKVLLGGMCSECGEHCEEVRTEESEET